MKNFTTLIFAVLIAGSVSAQSLMFGPMGAFKNTWLINKNVSDFGFEQDYQLSFGYDFGLNILFVGKSNKFGVEADFLQSTHTQNYIGEVGLDYTSTTEIKSFDVPLVVKFISKSLGYLELGVMYSTIQSATYTASESLFVTHVMPLDEIGNTTSFYEKSNLSALIGFGGEITVVEAFMFVTIGARFGFGIKDLHGTDGFGNNLDNDILYDDNTGIYKEYKATHTAFGAVILGLKFRIGKKENAPTKTN
jgi:hypothetical protein